MDQVLGSTPEALYSLAKRVSRISEELVKYVSGREKTLDAISALLDFSTTSRSSIRDSLAQASERINEVSCKIEQAAEVVHASMKPLPQNPKGPHPFDSEITKLKNVKREILELKKILEKGNRECQLLIAKVQLGKLV